MEMNKVEKFFYNIQKRRRIKKKKRMSRSVGGDIALFLMLCLFGAFSAYPLLYTIFAAFKPLNELFIYPPQFYVENPTMEQRIELLKRSDYGRCVYKCDNDVVDHQVVNMELENETTISFVVNAFTMDDLRATHIKMTHGEIDGDEKTLRVRKFRGNEQTIYDFSDLCSQPFHAGADLNIVEEFINSITRSSDGVLSSTIESSIESHVVCYEAETSRLTNQTILID